MREAARYPAVALDEGLDAALAQPCGPVVCADGADNAGGGAPADSTFVARRIIERGIRDVASGAYYDPMAVDICFEAGVGAVLDVRVGGKLGIASGQPLDLRATVRALREDHEQHSLLGTMSPGRSAWIVAAGIDFVLVSVRTQVFAPDAFTELGIDLSTKRIIVVKSMQHVIETSSPLRRVSSISPRRARCASIRKTSPTPSAMRTIGREFRIRASGARFRAAGRRADRRFGASRWQIARSAAS